MKQFSLHKFLLIIGLFLPLLFVIGRVFAPTVGLASTMQRNDQTRNSGQKDLCTVISSPVNLNQLSSNQSPWTESRMQAAEPYPLPNRDFNLSSTTATQQPQGEPVYIPSEPPKDFSFASEEQISGSSSAEALLGYTYPAPYTRYENFDDYKEFPYRTTGVLFFSQNGSDFRCSAASIGNNAVWTAGHCVHDGSGSPDGWSRDFLFVPAYKNGNMPYGSWISNDSTACSGWVEDANVQVDFGGVLLEENLSGKAVNEVVGKLGFAFNLNPQQHWFSLGYPSVTPFTGKTMQICAASFARNDPLFTFPFPMAIGCDMTGGSSGGPWIIDFSGSEGNTNYINGNNSYRYTGKGEEMYSPYFGEYAKKIFDHLSTATHLKTNIHLPFVTNNN